MPKGLFLNVWWHLLPVSFTDIGIIGFKRHLFDNSQNWKINLNKTSSVNNIFPEKDLPLNETNYSIILFKSSTTSPLLAPFTSKGKQPSICDHLNA